MTLTLVLAPGLYYVLESSYVKAFKSQNPNRTDRHTDRCDRTLYYSAFVAGNHVKRKDRRSYVLVGYDTSFQRMLRHESWP